MPPIIRVSPIRRGPLWTANQRVVDGPLEAVLGDDEVDVGAGGYDIGARARQIRDDLLGLTHPATEADMLAIQLDSRALFLARWRELLLALIDEQAMQAAPQRREFRELVSQWKPEAAPDAVVIAWCAPTAPTSAMRCGAGSPPPCRRKVQRQAAGTVRGRRLASHQRATDGHQAAARR